MNQIKNIIFDLGGVMINLRRENAVHALEQLGMADADYMLGLYKQQPPFLSLETGHLSAGGFFDMMRTRIGRQVSDMEIQNAVNAFLVDIPVERLEALRRLREKGYRLYVLSNTNAVMYHSWIDEAFRQIEPLSINDYFDGIVVSFEERTCKPDPSIFSTVIRRYGLVAEETVMLDDSQDNCDAARSVGLQAIRIGSTPEDDMLAVAARLEQER